MNELDLKIFANTVEPAAYSQIYRMMSMDAFRDARVRIMPDVHAGAGCVIGFTADLGNKVVPNLVGVDIGCGMYVECLGRPPVDHVRELLPALDDHIRKTIPCGPNVNEVQGTRVEFSRMEDLRMYKNLRNIKHLQSSIGTLGGGNHFIELDMSSTGELFLVIHSGSRNLGQQVCKHYQAMAIDDCNGHSAEIRAEIRRRLVELKEQGCQRESSTAIREIKDKYHSMTHIPTDLCYLQGDHREDYLHDMRLCQEFAVENREEMARRIHKFLARYGIRPEWGFHTVHNYIDFQDNIIRKGAIRCGAGEMVIIPLNMRDGSILARGRGNPDWNNSGPHGAGRLMSRSQARDSISMKDFKESMAGIYSTSVCRTTVDESPMAYKDAGEIIGAIGDTVEILDIIKPVYNFKASEEEKDYKKNR